MYELGQHAVIYGERGVGKTSLAKVLSDVSTTEEDELSVFVTCDSSDNYTSVWGKVFDEIRVERVQRGIGFKPEERVVVESIGDIGSETYRPNDVRSVLKAIAAGRQLSVFIDEFDQVDDEHTKALMADTIKMLSDQAIDVTVVFIGVADSVDDLIAEHASVERAIHQILMPRLDEKELRTIVTRALAQHDMKITQEALGRIVRLSQGLPHYTHLLGQYSSINAVLDGRDLVDDRDIFSAIEKALEKSQQSTQRFYLESISSSQKNMYPQVVLACALARRDQLGYFSPAEVRQPLSKILGRKVEIPNFMRHLNMLCEESRGPLLAVKGEPRRYRYRFIHPLMQPFVVMKGIADGLIDSSSF